LDFTNDDFHELHMWGSKYDITFEAADTYLELIEKLTGLLGRQPLLPEWFYEGAILGIQDGTDVCIDKVTRLQEAGAVIKGIWCQDWQGVRHTSFGKRLFWDWKWNQELYPGLDKQIKEWDKEGINFLAYFNPYLCNDGTQFVEAKEKGYLAFNQEGEVYEVDFGEYLCGIVDFTNPEAYEWYRDMIIKNAIDMGIKGWMADFGEYLPIDTVLYNGWDGMIAHNKWPALWAKVNYDALVESDTLGEIVYFMRAGGTGSQKYCTMIWAGDQNVDFSLDDGLASVVTAALSLGMSGYGLHHSDTGGYTTLYGMKRTKELFMKWTDFNTFTPVLRTHEGNRPGDNWQFDSDEETISHFAWASQVHSMLKDYISHLVAKNTDKGIPVMRPLFMHYEDDDRTYQLKYQYMLGRDMVVAPVYEEGASTVDIYLPDDKWINIWDGKEWTGGDYTVDAPIGAPAVFYRKDSKFKEVFEEITRKGSWKND
ncbi:MAG: alpha-glucosidase, partial [Epulopiscium sp.]|nr:alpha-glucosidase [Candidatus Epulonipiscium sp.]